MNFKICGVVNGNKTVKREINSDKDYSINTTLNLKVQFIGEKKKRIREMSSTLLLQVSSCATDNFPGTFADICFMVIAQRRINTYVDPCP